MAIEEPQFRPPEILADAPIVPQAEAISLPLDPLALLTTPLAAQEMAAVLPAEEDGRVDLQALPNIGVCGTQHRPPEAGERGARLRVQFAFRSRSVATKVAGTCNP